LHLQPFFVVLKTDF